MMESLFKVMESFEKVDGFSAEESEELEDSAYTDEEFEPVFEDLQFGEDRDFFSYEYMRTVLRYVEEHPSHTMATIRTKFRKVKYPYYITRFREYVSHLGTYHERWAKVAKHCKEMFDQFRANKLTVHDRTIRMWAVTKAWELELRDFKASPSWILNFKHKYRITSRKITKFVTFKNERRQEDIENEAVGVILDYIVRCGCMGGGRQASTCPPCRSRASPSYRSHSTRAVRPRTVPSCLSSDASIANKYYVYNVFMLNIMYIGFFFVNACLPL